MAKPIGHHDCKQACIGHFSKKIGSTLSPWTGKGWGAKEETERVSEREGKGEENLCGGRGLREAGKGKAAREKERGIARVDRGGDIEGGEGREGRGGRERQLSEGGDSERRGVEVEGGQRGARGKEWVEGSTALTQSLNTQHSQVVWP